MASLPYHTSDSNSHGNSSYVDTNYNRIDNSFMSPDQLDQYFKKAIEDGFDPSNVLINLRWRVECAELIPDGNDWIFSCDAMEHGRYVAYEKIIQLDPISESIIWFTNTTLI